MRCVILCFVILAFGCSKQIVDKSESRIRIGKATQLIDAYGAPLRTEIKINGANGMSDWIPVNEEQGAKILEIVRECFVIEFHYPGRPSPSLAAPHWVVRYTFGDDRELIVQILGRGHLIRLVMGDSMKVLDAEEQQGKIVELLDLHEK